MSYILPLGTYKKRGDALKWLLNSFVCKPYNKAQKLNSKSKYLRSNSIGASCVPVVLSESKYAEAVGHTHRDTHKYQATELWLYCGYRV